jgi:hypothetical protein
MRDDIMKRNISFILMIAVVLSMAGCTTPAQTNKDTLYGKDIFDPSKFSMATYTIGTEASENIGQLTVLSYTGEADGDRLASIRSNEAVSSRMDTWLNRSREGINKAIVTSVDSSGIQVAAPSDAFKVTMMDGAWNSPGSVYKSYDTQTVTVAAGTFENCSIYYGTKDIMFENGTVNLTVVYYMHPSSPVPVLYIIKLPSGYVSYALKSVYLPGDVDSTPERTAQSYFDRIGSGEYNKAARLLIKADGKPMDKASVDEMQKNMERTYGKAGEKMAIQYVTSDTATPIGTKNGNEAAAVQWHSIQYDLSSGEVYAINGTFEMVNDGGWKIIV